MLEIASEVVRKLSGNLSRGFTVKTNSNNTAHFIHTIYVYMLQILFRVQNGVE